MNEPPVDPQRLAPACEAVPCVCDHARLHGQHYCTCEDGIDAAVECDIAIEKAQEDSPQ